MKFLLFPTSVLAASSFLSAASVSVFFDNGSTAPGSTNTAIPFANNAREATWDILATAESGLSSVGGAVMQVRMVTLNVNGDSRRMTTAGGNGFGIDTGENANWVDGSTQEGAIFQFTVFSDVAKTTEVTGLTISLTSALVRMGNESRQTLSAYSGAGTITFQDAGSTVSSPTGNGTDIFLGGNLLNSANDTTNQSNQDLGLVPSGLTAGGAAGAPAFLTAESSGVSFSEDEVFWIRRRNTAGGPDGAYQVGALTFEVIPEPSSSLLIAAAALGCLRRRR